VPGRASYGQITDTVKALAKAAPEPSNVLMVTTLAAVFSVVAIRAPGSPPITRGEVS
jgi:hypothetical protein